MSNSRWRKVRADLSSNKLRSMLAVISLTVGTTAVGAMMFAGSILDASFGASLLDANPPSATLATGPFEAALVDDVVAHRSIDEAEGRRTHRTQLAGPDGTLVGVELVAMADLTDNHIARIDPVDGSWPPPTGAVVFERASIGELGAGLADVVQVEVPGAQPVDLEVAGTAFDVSEIAPMFGGSIRGYIAMDTMVELTGSDHLDMLYLRAATAPLDGDAASEAAAAVRDDVLRPAGVAVAANLVPEPGVHPAVDATSFIVRAMQLLSLLGLAIAVGLVLNTVTALLAQQRQQLGVMKAMGATVGQLSAQYLGYGLGERDGRQRRHVRHRRPPASDRHREHDREPRQDPAHGRLARREPSLSHHEDHDDGDRSHRITCRLGPSVPPSHRPTVAPMRPGDRRRRTA